MESNQEFNKQADALPVRSGTRLPSEASVFDAGQAEARVPIEGLWAPERRFSLSVWWARLSERTRKTIVYALAGLCLLALLVPLAVYAAGASDDGRGRLPGVLDGTGTSGTTAVTSAPTEAPTRSGPEAAPSDASENGTDLPPEPPTDAETAAPAETGTEAGSETVPSVTAAGTEALTEVGTPPESVPASEPCTEPDTEPDTERKTEPDTQPDVAGPGTVKRDMSESERGPDYVLNDTDRDPRAVGAWAPGYVEPPVILLVCSRPFEAYADGDGGGTVTDLAGRLADELRSRGLTVVLVGPSLTGLTAQSSVKECRERTQSLIRYYCRLYSDVALILDLRRGAEMAEGALLATSGAYEGRDSAQLRFIADALRPDGVGVPAGRTSALDCSLAQALRRAVFEISPTVSRPVWWRVSSGLVPGDLCASGAPFGADPADGPRLVSVELGSAGNTYASADALVPLLARAVAAVMVTHLF